MSQVHNDYDGGGNFVFEDYKGQSHKFKDRRMAEIFEDIDKLEEGIRDKYFDSDEEFTIGIALVKKMKGQLRRMGSDMEKVITIRFHGMPDEDEE